MTVERHGEMNFERLLVATKFAPPRIGSRFIARRQLLQALHRERGRKLTLVPGSAGFGKTILLAQWRQELMKDGRSVAWLSLSPDERSLSNFSAHLFAALARLGLPIENELSVMGQRGRSTDAAVALIVNHLATVQDDLYLIVDDYHHVEDPAAHTLVQKLIEFSPGNLHVVLASRALPPLSVARLRVMGQVSEIDCGDLPFDMAETRAFLEQNMSGVTTEEVRQIHDLTNGWPACVQLVSIMLKDRPERRGHLHDLAWQSSDLQNYLSEDVVARLPADIAEFMESVSICRRFNPELAAVVSANPDAPALLRRIEEENLLITRTESDDRSPWYRFHPLFADFLAARLQRRGQDAVAQLHRRASAWCAEKGLVLEAVRHANLGDDIESAVAIFDQVAPTKWRLSHFAPMLHLLNNLPAETIGAHRRLLLLAALTTALTGRAARATVWLEQLRATGMAETQEGRFRLDLIEALIASQRDDTFRTYELLAPLKANDARTSLERFVFLSVFGYSLVAMGRFGEAYKLLEDNPPTPDEREEDLVIVTESCRSPWRLLEGRALEAERIGSAHYARAVAALGSDSIAANLLATALAGVMLELNRIEDARELMANRLHNLSTYPFEPMVNAALTRARLDLLQDSPASALASLENHVALFRSVGLDRGVAHALAEQARIHLLAGDRARAVEAIERLAGVAERNEGQKGFRAHIAGIHHLARGRLLAHDGAHDEALAAFDALRELALQFGRGGPAVTADILSALVLRRAGRPEEAQRVFTRAVERAAPMGLVRTFLEEGDEAAIFLSQIKASGSLSGQPAVYVDMLLREFGAASNATPDAAGAKEKTPLTPREVEILGLVATGMSNKRIALTLNITLETVKWNLKNVFVKLAVSSRYDAMTWARHQGLIA